MCSSLDTLSAIEAGGAGVDLESIRSLYGHDLGSQCPLGPPLPGHRGRSPGTATSLGSAGGCIFRGTIRKADGTLHTQVPKPCNMGPQPDFPSRGGAGSWHWRGLAVCEGEEKLQRKKS